MVVRARRRRPRARASWLRTLRHRRRPRDRPSSAYSRRCPRDRRRTRRPRARRCPHDCESDCGQEGAARDLLASERQEAVARSGGPPRAEDGPHPAPTRRRPIETTSRKISRPASAHRNDFTQDLPRAPGGSMRHMIHAAACGAWFDAGAWSMSRIAMPGHGRCRRRDAGAQRRVNGACRRGWAASGARDARAHSPVARRA
jgi:hypothetical protein